MNTIYKLAACLFMAVVLTSSCADFFDPETDTTLQEEAYINDESEIYTGFMGIITKMQAVGDKTIYLNEMRAEMMEPTASSPRELYSLYNYDDDLEGNTYADPAGYYEVINACNDYLRNLKAYKDRKAIDMAFYRPLVSSTLRIKAWTFMTLAKTYGEVVWLDKPMNSLRDLSQFKKLNLDETMAACKNMLDFGYDDVDGTYNTTWHQWLNPTGDEATSPYRYWDLMTPPYYALYGELCLWLGQYRRCIDVIQGELNARYRRTNAQNIAFLRNDNLLGKLSSLWNTNTPYAYEAAAGVAYMAKNGQANSLLKHFDFNAPNKYWIAPAKVACDRFSDPTFDPLGTKTIDPRASSTFIDREGRLIFNKFRPTSWSVRQPYEDDAFIYTYRGADLYFMMAEAFNELGKTDAVDALINRGVTAYMDMFDKDADGNLTGTWNGFTPHWTTANTMYYLDNGTTAINSRKYGDRGIRGYGYGPYNMASRTFEAGATEKNAEEILKEMVLDMAGEGRTLPAMIRMARRYKNNTFMANLIAEKYAGKANAEVIRQKLLN